jgi:hypothetical protein
MVGGGGMPLQLRLLLCIPLQKSKTSATTTIKSKESIHHTYRASPFDPNP